MNAAAVTWRKRRHGKHWANLGRDQQRFIARLCEGRTDDEIDEIANDPFRVGLIVDALTQLARG